MKDNLSVWSAYLYHLGISWEEKIDIFLRSGFSCTEFSDEDGFALLDRGPGAAKELRRYADSQGFAFPQGHLWLRANICVEGTNEILKRWLDMFLDLGIRSAVLHAASLPELSGEALMERRVNALRELTDYIRGTDMTICLENLKTTPEAVTAAHLNRMIDAVGDANLGICLDTGHLNTAEEKTSQREFILTAGKRLKALHVDDNDGVKDLHKMPFSGTIDWAEVADALREVGYDRLFNLEIPGENSIPQGVHDIKLRYLRDMYDTWFLPRLEGKML